MAGTNSLEIEIHSLFQEGASIEYVCRELIAKYEKNEVLSPSEVEGLCHFLMSSGHFDLLKEFLINCITKDKINFFPVGFFIESSVLMHDYLTDEIIDVAESIIEKQDFESSSLQSQLVQTFSTKVAREKTEIQKNYLQDRLGKKTRLIEQLNHYRQHQLIDQEESVLQQLTKLYPQDLEVGLLKQAHLEKKADEILNRVISRKTLTRPKSGSQKTPENKDFIEDFEKNIIKVSNEIYKTYPDQLYNLAILAFQFELYESCLKILDRAPRTNARDWLKAEALSEAGRFLDLLKLLENLEEEGSDNHELAFGVAYLKAIALHGLGQKDMAIKLLENIQQMVPFYRSSEALLQDWKTS